MTGLPTSVPPVSGPETPALTQSQRVVSTFTAPSKTFKDILRDTSWWLPFLLSVVFSFLFVFAVQKQVGWEKVSDNQMKLNPKQVERMQNMPPDQLATTRNISAKVTQYISYGFPVLTLIIAVVFAAVLLATLNFGFGGQANFAQMFAVVFYAWLPGLIKTLLAIIILFAGVDPDSFLISNPVGTNLGYYLSVADTPKWLYTVATSLDVFAIWTFVLLAIGCATVAKVKRSAGYTAVFGWWILILLVRVAIAAVTG